MTSEAQLIDELKVARQQISGLEKKLGEALGIMLHQPKKEILPIEGAFETSPHGIVIIQPQAGLMIRCNPAFARLVGRSIQDVIGLPFLNLTVADDHTQVIQTISELNNQENTGCEAYFIHKDGTIFPAQVDFAGIQDADGNILYCVATLQDITERKNADEKMRFQSKLLDVIGQAVIVTDMDGKINFWNQAAENLYGWKVDEVLGQTIFEMVVPEISEQQARQIMQELNSGKMWSGEFMVRKRDGTIFWSQVTDMPIYSTDGQVMIGLIGVSMDISERKRVEISLYESERHNRLLFEESPDASTLIDSDGRIIRANRAYEQLTKISLEQMIGKTLEELGIISSETKVTLKNRIAQAISPEDQFVALEYLLYCADGSVRNVESRVFPLKYGGMEGVFQARNLQPDLILMDIEMPIMDGFEVTNLIRSEPELTHIPIIAMTALVMTRVRERCQAAGMAEYISKPVILKDVLILIKKLLVPADARGK